MKVHHSKATKLKIKSCTQILAATQFPFEMQIPNEVNALNQTDPILQRITALMTTDPSSEETGVAAIQTGDVTSDVTPEHVARWMVGLETAKNS